MTPYDNLKNNYDLTNQSKSLAPDKISSLKYLAGNIDRIKDPEQKQKYISEYEYVLERYSRSEANRIQRQIDDRQNQSPNFETQSRKQKADSTFKEATRDKEARTGFISRPRTEDYLSLVESGGAVGMPKHIEEAKNRGEEVEKPVMRGAMFQLHQKEVVDAMLSRFGDVEMVTQIWDKEHTDSVSANLFAPNVMVQSVAAKINATDKDGNKAVITVGKKRKGGSFHPKVGYVKGWNHEHLYAFIGSQNITPALDKNSTMESMMVLDAKAADRHLKNRNSNYVVNKDMDLADKLFNHESVSQINNLINHRLEGSDHNDPKRMKQERDLLARKFVEQRMGEEVVTLSDDLITAARKNPDQHFSNLALAQLREDRRSTDATSNGLLQNFTLYNHEILEEYNSVLDTATKAINSNSGEVGMVYMSINRMEGLLRLASKDSESQFKNMKDRMVELAQAGKLQVVTDRRNYSKEVELDNIDEDFLRKLSKAGSIKFDPVMHHDKGILITNEEGVAVYSGIQSANPSKVSMSTKNESITTEDGRTIGVSGDESSTEVMLRIRGGIFLDALVGSKVDKDSKAYERQKKAYEDYMEYSGIKEHYASLGGKSKALQDDDHTFSDDQGFSTMHYAEQRANSTGVEEFMKKIDKINEQYGKKVIEVTPRYAPGESYRKGGKTFQRGYKEMVGLRVRVNSAYQGTLNARGLEIDLTVNRENNVIVSDLNKLMGSSLVLNRTEEAIDVPGTDKSIAPKQSMQLNSQETALSALTTMVSEVSYKHRYGLSGAVYLDMNDIDPLATDKGLESTLNHLLLKELISKNPNDRDIRNLINSNADLSHTITLLSSKNKGKDIYQAIQSVVNYASSYDINTGEKIEDDSIRRKKRATLESIMAGLENSVEFAVNSKLEVNRLYPEVAKSLLGAETTPGTDLGLLRGMNNIIANDYAGEGITVLEDFRSVIVSRNAEYSEKYNNLEKKQSREILTLITDPYLAPHDQQRSGMQRSLPVYAIEEDRVSREGENLYNRAVRMGILDPAAVGHADSLGSPGEFQIPLASVSHKDTREYGKAGSAIVVGDTQASVIKVIEMRSILEGLSGFGYSDIDSEINELIGLFKDTLKREPTKKELEQMIENKKSQYTATFKELPKENTPLYLIPYNKIEQITQRFKNVVGARPAKEVSNEVYQRLLDQEYGVTPDDLKNLLIGNLRASLPNRKWNVLKAHEQEYREVRGMSKDEPIQDYNEFLSFLMEMENDPLHENVGLVGSQQLKRVAIHGGFNTLGDYGVLNDGVEQPYAETKTTKLTFDLGSLQSITGITQKLSKYMSKGSKVIGDGPNAGFYVSEERLHYDEVEHRHVSRQVWVKAGTFTETGQIEFNRSALEKLAPNRLSLRVQPVTMSVGAYGKSFEGGISIFTGDLTIDTSSRGTLIATQEQTTINMPGSGSRRSGEGNLPKGPQYVVQEEIFNKIEGVLNERRTKFKPSNKSVTDKVFQLATLSQFKGFNYETGMTILTDKRSRDYLSNALTTDKEKAERGEDIAQSLGFLLVGDKQIQSALSEHYRSKEQYTTSNVIKGLKGSNVSSDKLTSLNILAQGLAALNKNSETVKEDIVEGELRNLKDLVRQALSADETEKQTAQKELAETSSQLFKLVTSDEKYARIYGGGTPQERRSLKEQSSAVKSAGILAHILYFNQQLFGESGPQGMRSVGGLYQQQIPSGSDYLEIKRKIDRKQQLSDDERRRYDFANYIAASTGLRVTESDSETDILRKMDLLRDAQKNDVLVEFFVDSSSSKSLVSAGQKDQVSFEFNKYLGLRKGDLDRFRDKESLYKELSSIQDAYSTLTAAVGGVHKTSLDRMEVRTVFNTTFDPKMSEDNYFWREEIELEKKLNAEKERIRNDQTLTDTEKKNRIQKAEEEHNQEIHKLKVQLSQKRSQYSRQELDIRLAAQAYSSYQDSHFNKLLEESTSKGREYTAYERPAEVESAFQDLRNNMEVARKETSHTSDQHKDYMHGVLKAFQHFHSERNRLDAEISQLEREIKEGKYQGNDRVREGKRLNNLKLEKKEAIRHIKSLGKTQQIIIPHMDVQSIDEEGKEGMYIARIRDFDDESAKSSVGVVLGADLLQQLSLVFGSHKDEAIIAQINLLESLELAQPVLNKIQDPTNNELTEAEARALISLQEAARQSSESLTAQVTNETMKKAYGEHENFSGAVGYALNSFALSPHEMVLGGRFSRITEDYQMDVMINRELQGFGDIVNINNKYEELEREERFLTSIERLESLIAPLAPHLAEQREGDRMRGLNSLEDFNADPRQEYAGIINFIKEFTKEANNESLVYQAFQKYINQIDAKGESLKREQRARGKEKAVKAYYYQRILGLKKESEEGYKQELAEYMNTMLSQEEDNKKKVSEWDKQLNMMLGGQVRRSGSPNADYALMGEFSPDFRTLTPEQFEKRLEDEGSSLLPSKTRSNPLLMVPSLSSVIAGLGDYDGDSYPVLLSKAQEAQKKVLEKQKEYYRAREARIAAKVKWKQMTANAASEPSDPEVLRAQNLAISQKMQSGFIEAVQEALEKSKINAISDKEKKNYRRGILRLQENIRENQMAYNSLNELFKEQSGIDEKSFGEKKEQQKDNTQNIKALAEELLGKDIHDEKLMNYLNAINNAEQESTLGRERILDLRDEISEYANLLERTQIEEESDVGKLASKAYTGAELRKKEKRNLEEQEESYNKAVELEKQVDVELNKAAHDFEDKGAKLKEGYEKHMNALGRFVKNFTSLPSFAFEGLSTTEQLTYISQKFDDSGVQDATWLKQAERKIDLFGQILGNQQESIDNEIIKDFQTANSPEDSLIKARGYLKNISKEKREELLRQYSKDESEATDMAAGELVELMKQVDQGEVDKNQILTSFYSKAGNYQQTVEDLNKSFKKVEGVVLNPFEYEAIQGTIGEGGSKLIGAAYNTLIPLMERSMFEQGILTAMNASDEKNKMLKVLEAQGQEDLVNKLSDEHFKDTAQQRYYSTLSTMTSFQQLVRDALKAKSGSALNEAFKDSGYIDAIKQVDDLKKELSKAEGEERADEVRKQLAIQEQEVEKHLYSSLINQTGTVVSPEETAESQTFLSQFSGDNKKDLFSSNAIYDPNLTAFGVLMELNKFTKLESSSNIYDEFINKQGNNVDMKAQEAERYVAGQIAESIQRTEAAYKATTLTEQGQKILIEKAMSWYEKNKDKSSGELSETEKSYKDLIDSYQQSLENIDREKMDREKMDKLLTQELILTKLREDNKKTGSMTADTVMMLREMEQAKRSVSNDEYGIDSSRRAIGNVVARDMARGKVLDSGDAVAFTNWNLQTIDYVLEQMGYSKEEINKLSPQERAKVQAKIAKISPTGAFQGMGDLAEMTQSQQNALVGLISGLYDSDEYSASESLKYSTEGMSQILQYTERLSGEEVDDMEAVYLHEQINNLTTSQGKTNVSLMRDLDNRNINQTIENFEEARVREIEQGINSGEEGFDIRDIPKGTASEGYNQPKIDPELIRWFEDQTSTQQPGTFRGMTPPPPGGTNPSGGQSYYSEGPLNFQKGALEGDMFGALGSLALFGLIGSDETPEDERIAMMGIDAAMAMAEIMGSQSKGKKTWTGSLIGGDMSTEMDFKSRLASLRQSMEAQGATRGFVQGMSQQMVSRGFNNLAGMAVERMMPVRSNVKGTRAIAGAATEILGSLMSTSVSRAITRSKTNAGTRVQDFVSRFLINYVENVWQMVEQMQLALLNSNTEVLDSSHNNNWDFDTDGYLSEFAWDVESGMIVLDSNDTPLETAFEEDASNNQNLQQSVDQTVS